MTANREPTMSNSVYSRLRRKVQHRIDQVRKERPSVFQAEELGYLLELRRVMREWHAEEPASVLFGPVEGQLRDLRFLRDENRWLGLC